MKNRRFRYWLRTSILTVVVVLLGFTLYKTFVSSSEKVLHEGEQAADFTLESLEGKKVRLSEELQGKAVMLNFWGTWCVPCKTEMPAIERRYQKYKDQGFTVLAINAAGESKLAVHSFVEDYELTFPVLLDPEKEVTRDLYKVIPLPTSVFIKPDGTIHKIAQYELNDTSLETFIKEIMP
ncbi:thiol-disulfide oxidoreductase ResA [Numidum massiliense]|uniref:thiol-disulfide oxidoreductase ResA n=1 Tax=Numidum massiliense TaxID=1522315 RepID=UPI0006D55B85|nr:thiol-disulfide oxidoreductase ResA [Numidum massiliense]